MLSFAILKKVFPQGLSLDQELIKSGFLFLSNYLSNSLYTLLLELNNFWIFFTGAAIANPDQIQAGDTGELPAIHFYPTTSLTSKFIN